MLIPQYTPFCRTEAIDALLITSEEYFSATHTGALARSIQFEERASPSVSMHSLVDITRFSVFKLSGWPNEIAENSVEAIELCLDAMCLIFEENQKPTDYQSPFHLAADVSDMVSYWEKYDDRVRFVTSSVVLTVCQCWLRLTRKLSETLARDDAGGTAGASSDDVVNSSIFLGV